VHDTVQRQERLYHQLPHVRADRAETRNASLSVETLPSKKSNVPGTDPNAAEVIKSLKEYVPAAAENYLGEPPTDQEDSADR
jgi:hypothetical protein